MKIGDLVRYYDSFESIHIYGIVIRETEDTDSDNCFDIFWFDDFAISADEKEGLNGITLFNRV
tara:strand:- start:7583 stop:7771 length:189 start_codon:yes stop_codon:yes gene_type:complete